MVLKMERLTDGENGEGKLIRLPEDSGSVGGAICTAQ